MIRCLPVEQLSDSEQHKAQFAEWVWASHSWVEYQTGYYKCEWCNQVYTTEMPFDFAELCRQNPAIKELLNGQDKTHTS
jgi:hypothetical protein